jgi:gliding motility-associated-like protein
MLKLLSKFLIAFVLLLPFAASATHIVGGELNYKYLGGNNYEIRLTVYRDCWNGVPPFDDPAAVGIFDSNNVLLDTLMMTFLGLDTLPPTINSPCFTPPTNVCYEVTTYIDTVNLPPIPGGYQLAYQRCCRNMTILNIVNPAGTGATYYATIPDPSVVTVNSNPVFKFWPPPFLCANVPFSFDHSAIDYDGDSLVYDLFMPFEGANTANPMPQPPYNPAYNTVTWQSPYSTSNMMGGVPLTINPQTGWLTCTPNTVGQFVVGMKVREYRNGVFISETKRDYQFNVVNCPNYVVASAQVPNLICAANTVSFSNTSNGAGSFTWNFGDPTTLADTSHATSPSYTYPDTGSYQVMLVAYSPNNPGCNDTSYSSVHIQNAYTANFTFTSDPCIGNELSFTATSSSPSNAPPSWYWSFGDSDSSSLQNPTHTYSSPGDYTVILISTIPGGLNCTDTVAQKVISISPDADLFIPNTFTPNGDNNNDLFRVRGKAYTEFYFAVYNRWGEKVFETTNQSEGWDGTYKGRPADPGVFAWYMKVSCGGVEAFRKGNVTLLR